MSLGMTSAQAASNTVTLSLEREGQNVAIVMNGSGTVVTESITETDPEAGEVHTIPSENVDFTLDDVQELLLTDFRRFLSCFTN